MSNKIYPNTEPFSQERNTNVNFNYVWDENSGNWIPQVQSSITLDYVLNNAKSFVHKFGSNPDINQNVNISSPETIWDGSNLYQFPSDDGEFLEIVSSSASDTQNVLVQGLDENFMEKTWVGQLSGLTPVNLDGLWSRVFRAYNDNDIDFVGDISIRQQSTSTPNYTTILSSNNQTLMSVYTIPADRKGYLIKYQSTAYNPQSSSEIGYTLQMRVRKYSKTFRTQSITSVGTSHAIIQEFPFPIELSPKSDIMFNVVGANGNNGAINVDFDIALL
jgi:hypothetical protein